jgi:hypothetical protein
MKTTTTKATTGIKVNAGIKAGGLCVNHNPTAIRVKSSVRAGSGMFCRNHSIRFLGY